MTLLDAHFNRNDQHLSPEEKMIYVKALWRFSREQIEEGFSRALHECSPFMPKIAEIESRMPEAREYFEPMSAAFVPVKDWYEPYTDTAKLHVWEDERGMRRVAAVKLKLGERPPRIAGPAPGEYISWDDAWEQIKNIAKAKKL